MWNWKEGEWLKKIDCVHIFMRLYFNTEISIGETKVMKSCKVNTLVNTNHCLQNLKKRYRFSLAIVVPQSGSHSHSGDRLFEWPKLSKKKNSQWQMKALTVKFTISHIHKLTFCGVPKICHNLIEWKCIFCILFALQRLFDNFNHFKTFFQCKTD